MRAILLAMLAALLSGIAATAGAGVASACEANVSTSSAFAATLPPVLPWRRGPAVVGLQLALRDAGYQLDGVGRYGPKTLAAVRDFQRKHGIRASGMVGSRTWQALVGSKNVDSVRPHQPPAQGLRPGDRNADLMAQLSNALTRIHPYDQQLPQYTDGYGAEWQALVRDFQQRAGIRASGIVGPATWRAMYQVISISGQWGC